MQAKINDNKIKIELITLGKLREYSEGKTKNVLENFTLFVREKNKIEQEERAKPFKAKQSLSLDQKIKNFFSYFITKKDQGEESGKKLSLGDKKDLESKIDIKAENSFERKATTFPKKPKKNITVFVIVLLFLITGIILLSFSDENLSNVSNFMSGIVEKGKSVLGFESNAPIAKNEIYELQNEPQEQEQEEEIPVDYSALSAQQLLGGGQIMEINLFSRDLARGKRSFFKKIWQGIFGAQDDEQGEGIITRESIYTHIEQNLNRFAENEVYFLNIYKGDHLLTLDELVAIFELRLMPNRELELKEKLAIHKLLVYFEPKDAKVNSQIRIGMLLIFKEGESFSLESLKSWEATMVNDLRFLYPNNNIDLLKNENKLFNNSTISERRRYVNFTSDQLLSLDYAAAQDGIVIVTSKRFGTTILKLLLENEAGESNLGSSSGELESEFNEANETEGNIPQ